MPGPRRRKPAGRPPGSTQGATRERLLALLVAEHGRSGLWLSRDAAATRLHLSPQTITVHRRELIRAGALPAQAASQDRVLRPAHLPKRLRVFSNHEEDGGYLVLAALAIDVVDLVTGGADDCYAVMVAGKAMEAPTVGLVRGAYAIVRPATTAPDGAVVLARISTTRSQVPRLTIRRSHTTPRGRVALQPLDADAAPVRTSEQLTGIVVSVVRRTAS